MPTEFKAEDLNVLFEELNKGLMTCPEPTMPGMIPAGTYQGRQETVLMDKSKSSGRPFLAVNYTLLGPEEALAGVEVRWVTNFVNEMNFTIFKGHLYRLGIRSFTSFKDAIQQLAALNGSLTELRASEPKNGYQNINPNRIIAPPAAA